MDNKIYGGYGDYAVLYDAEKHVFEFRYIGRGKVLEAEIEGIYFQNEPVFAPVDYTCEASLENKTSSCVLTVKYKSQEKRAFAILFNISDMGIKTEVNRQGDFDVRFTGDIFFGKYMGKNSFAMRYDNSGKTVRSALGPASSSVDNCVFDRFADSALCFEGGQKLRIKFNHKQKCYSFKINTGPFDYSRGFGVFVKNDIYKELYKIDYKTINKSSIIKRPYAGFMTWYALGFDVTEGKLLENAAFMAENLKDFGADIVWVDWEWCHKDFQGERNDGADSFNPDKGKYPNGLAYIAKEIKKLGLIPALWIAPTNDPAKNELIEKYPEIVLAQKTSWCGKYFLDITHPVFLEEYLPKILKQVKSWGFEAIKWDCIPITLNIHNELHEKMYDPSKTVKEAYRNMVKKAREIMGEDFFMLSCSCEKDADILFAADMFDGARVGGDIFEWDAFVTQCIEKVFKFYPLHNVLFYNDPDNLILRSKFNNPAQAVSRAAFLSILGLPVTIGDDFSDLLSRDIEILKKVLPPVDAHPMDFSEEICGRDVLISNLAVEKSFESWNVVNALNLTESNKTAVINFYMDLQLEEGLYLVYDFWNKSFLGICEDSITLDVLPFETKTLSFRKLLDRPQIITTSRHVTAGAAELVNVYFDSETLSGVSKVVKGNSYEILFYIPDNYICESLNVVDNTAVFTTVPEFTGEFKWSVKFRKK